MTVASFAGVCWHMRRGMRPPTGARVRGEDAGRPEAGPTRRAGPGRPFAGREGAIGAGVLGTVIAASCAYLVARSGVPPYPILGLVAGFAVGHVLAYATTRPRGLRKPICAFWIVVSLVGLLLLLDTVPPGEFFVAGADGARWWAPPAFGLLSALAVSSATRLSALWQSGRWKGF